MSNAYSPSKKGKLKAFSSDYDDLNPIITYRHLQSPTIGPKHPLRIVALCDCNAFYANCEQVRLKLDPQTPLVVLQWGMLIAVNYPARDYGISRMDKLDDALKRCPDLKVVHVATYAKGENEPKYWDKPDVNTHKISLDLYRRESIKVHSMFTNLLSTGEVEKASIDEAFIDFSIPVRDLLLERYPYLAEPPPSAPDGLDTPLPPPPKISFTELGNLIPVDPTKAPPDTKLTTEMVEEMEEGVPITWHDIGLVIAAELMAKMRKEVHEKLGYLTSAGIARNKFLAKLAASYRKFNTQNILRNSAIPGFLKPMPFQKIRFLGGKLGKALAGEYDVSTVGDLLSISLDDMQAKFGECSIWVYEILRGIDRSEVKEKGVINKSMSATKNLPRPVTKASEGPQWLRMLAAELAIRLNEAREERPGFWPRTLSLHVSQGWHITRSKQRPFPPAREQAVGIDFVTDEAMKLWREISATIWGDKKEMKVTHIGLSYTGIRWSEEGQKGIEGFFSPKPPSREARAASEHLVPVAGPSSAGNVTNGKRKRSVSLTPAVTQQQNLTTIAIDEDTQLEEIDSYSFVCSRCHKTVSLPADFPGAGLSSTVETELAPELAEMRNGALERLRIEHDDYHFAQDLARQDRIPNNITPMKKQRRDSRSPDRPTKRKKAPKIGEAQGIAKYFTKRTTA